MLMQRLKHETRSHHEQIERTLQLSVRCQSLAGYRAVLVRFYGFYAPIEAALAQVDGLPVALADLSARWKTQRIARDLEALDLPVPAQARIDLCPDLPDLAAVAQAFGCLYVLEGATLGGQMIARQLAANLGLSPERGGTFFSGYGPETGPRWRAFGEQLVTYVTTPATEAVIVDAARETFCAFEGWLGGKW